MPLDGHASAEGIQQHDNAPKICSSDSVADQRNPIGYLHSASNHPRRRMRTNTDASAKAEPLVIQCLRECSLAISPYLSGLSDVTTLHDRVCKSLRTSHMQVKKTVYCYPETANRLLARNITLKDIAGWNQDTHFTQMWRKHAECRHNNKFNWSQVVCSSDLTIQRRREIQKAYWCCNVERFCLEDFPIHAVDSDFMFCFPPSTTDLKFVRPKQVDTRIFQLAEEHAEVWVMNLEDCRNLRSFQIVGELQYIETHHWFNLHVLTELAFVDQGELPIYPNGRWGNKPDMSELIKQSKPVWALTSLRLVNCRLYTVHWLKHMPELCQLDISVNPGLQSLDPLGDCRKLKALDLRDTVNRNTLSHTNSLWTTWVEGGMIGGAFQGCAIFLRANDEPFGTWMDPCRKDSASWAFGEVITVLSGLMRNMDGLRHSQLDYHKRKVGEGLIQTNFLHDPHDTAMLTIFSRDSVEERLNAPNGMPPPDMHRIARGWWIYDY